MQCITFKIQPAHRQEVTHTHVQYRHIDADRQRSSPSGLGNKQKTHYSHVSHIQHYTGEREREGITSSTNTST